MPRRRRHPLRYTALLTVAVVIIAVAGFLAYRHVAPIVSGCESDGGGQAVMLDVDQAAIAADIAGVAAARNLPQAAVTIAYATAWQESHLHNLRYGTMDSIGVFQQRPSQGWGTPKQLADPVYAAGKFFAALVRVPHYSTIPIYQAAQDVQHSADGSAYMNYQQQAALMSGPFSGGTPHAVWCWYAKTSTKTQLTTMRKGLVHAFGRLKVRMDGPDQVVAAVPVHNQVAGWAVASWLVTHATSYGIDNVRYAGYQWSAGHGSQGWTHDPSASSGSVELR